MDFHEEINYNRIIDAGIRTVLYGQRPQTAVSRCVQGGEAMRRQISEGAGKTEERAMYIVGWFLIGGLALIAVSMRLLPQLAALNQRPCMFKTMTGLYCPGCGGTRAVVSLLQGRLVRSLLLHPFVFYVAVVGGWFMISQTIQRLSGGKLPIGMKYRELYLWIALALVVANFLVKNILLLCGVDVIALAA